MGPPGQAEHLHSSLFLVLDDVHLLGEASEPIRILDWLIGRAPPDLHVVLSTRYPPSLPSLVTWRVRGEVLEIGERELAFTPDEIASLFRDLYGLPLSPQEIEQLTGRTEGWAIALQLVWQGLRSGAVPTLSQSLERLSSPRQDLFPPSKAEHLLQEALRLADGQEDRETRARLLELLAENRLNLGRPEEAERLRAQARELREEGPGEAELAVRVLLRTGRLAEAQRLLEERAEAERKAPVLRPRAHRETLLLLSLILSLQGHGEEAHRCAVEGTQRGRVLHSPFVIAVGYMRQGHAWLLRDVPEATEQACRCYREAIALGDQLAVPRLKVEAYWGLCRARGFQGDLASAREAAEQGIEIAQRAGDEWIAALIRVSMGAGFVLAGRHDEAARWLDRAWTAFRECSDTFGEAVARLWQCLLWRERGEWARLERGIGDLLGLVRRHGYGFLFERRTLLGPPDPRRLVPLLLFARETGREAATAEAILARLGLADAEIHPGYQLRVQTLGPFRVWRGEQEVAPHDWQREKARQLLVCGSPPLSALCFCRFRAIFSPSRILAPGSTFVLP